MNDFDSRISGKSGFVESENGGEAMRLHCRDQAGVVRGLARNLMLSDEGLQTGKIVGVSGNRRNMLLSRASSAATAGGLIPRPFCSTGRVATTHSSTRF